MKTIHPNDLLAKLKELNPDFHYHMSDGRCVYYGGRLGLRVGDRWISNVEPDVIPLKNIYSRPRREIVHCSVQRGLTSNCFHHQNDFAHTNEMYWLLNEIMKDEQEVLLPLSLDNRFKGLLGDIQECFLRRRVDIAPDKSRVPIIEVHNFMEYRELPSHLEKIGLVTVCERILQSKVPGVTKTLLEEKLNISLPDIQKESINASHIPNITEERSQLPTN